MTKEISELSTKQLQLKQQEQFILANISRIAQEADKRKTEQEELKTVFLACEDAVAQKTAQIDEVQKQMQALEVMCSKRKQSCQR